MEVSKIPKVRTLRGLVAPSLLWGMDWRLLLAAALLTLAGIYSWPLWIFVPILIVGGKALGSFSPRFLNDMVTYIRWRWQAADGYVPDESAFPVDEWHGKARG